MSATLSGPELYVHPALHHRLQCIWEPFFRPFCIVIQAWSTLSFCWKAWPWQKHKVLNLNLGPKRYTKLGLSTNKQTFRSLLGNLGGYFLVSSLVLWSHWSIQTCSIKIDSSKYSLSLFIKIPIHHYIQYHYSSKYRFIKIFNSLQKIDSLNIEYSVFFKKSIH